MATDTEAVHTEYGIPLGWCPKCPNGIGIATGDGRYECDHCGHVGPDPRSTPGLEPGPAFDAGPGARRARRRKRVIG